MTTRQIHFFATRNDQMLLLESVEQNLNFNYALTGMSASLKPAIYNPGISIPTLGIVRTEDAIAGDCYLVKQPGDQILAEEIRHIDGASNMLLINETIPIPLFSCMAAFTPAFCFMARSAQFRTRLFRRRFSNVSFPRLNHVSPKMVATTLGRRQETSRKQAAV